MKFKVLLRFVFFGGCNTLITYLLYLALLDIFPYQVSYTIAFCAGIILSYALNRFFVFQAKGRLQGMLFFPLIYVTQYMAGLIIVLLWVEVFNWNVSLAPIVAIVLTIPLTFILTQWVFKKEA